MCLRIAPQREGKLDICFLTPVLHWLKAAPGRLQSRVPSPALISRLLCTRGVGSSGAGQSAPGEKRSDLAPEVVSSQCTWEMSTTGKLTGRPRACE